MPGLDLAARSNGTYRAVYPDAGISFRAPNDWGRFRGQLPLVVTFSSGSALVALWRYPRSEPLPSDTAGARSARVRLLKAVRVRDPGVRVIRSMLVSVDGARAIELDALERIAGSLRRTRSVHMFAFGAELVLDEYAPPSDFHAVDHDVFSPLRRSLRVFPAAHS